MDTNNFSNGVEQSNNTLNQNLVPENNEMASNNLVNVPNQNCSTSNIKYYTCSTKHRPSK